MRILLIHFLSPGLPKMARNDQTKNITLCPSWGSIPVSIVGLVKPRVVSFKDHLLEIPGSCIGYMCLAFSHSVLEVCTFSNWKSTDHSLDPKSRARIFSSFAYVHSNLLRKIFQINGERGLGSALKINISASGRLFRPRSRSRSALKEML